MKARRVRVLTSMLGLIAVLGVSACRIEKVDRPSRIDAEEVAREGISRVLDAYRDALLHGDAAAVAATFTPDGQLQQQDRPDIAGTSEIRAAMQDNFRSHAVTDLLFERERIDVGDGIAYEMGRFEETVQTAQGAPLELRGRYVIRWRRGPEAQWLIERLFLNHYPPADTAATR